MQKYKTHPYRGEMPARRGGYSRTKVQTRQVVLELQQLPGLQIRFMAKACTGKMPQMQCALFDREME